MGLCHLQRMMGRFASAARCLLWLDEVCGKMVFEEMYDCKVFWALSDCKVFWALSGLYRAGSCRADDRKLPQERSGRVPDVQSRRPA